MTDPVLFERLGTIGIVTLNRPQALNALTLDMIERIAAKLAEWASDRGVRAVVATGAGDRAFCAGGDVRAIYDSGLGVKAGTGDGRLTRDFFRAEYRLNWQIHSYPKPYIALIDGITMGGGVGLAIHGRYQVATERTLVAMPECGLGLFPDVGAGWLLPRRPGALGPYLALTGTRLGAADALHAGFASHFMPSARLAQLIDRISSGERIEPVLQTLAEAPGEAALAQHREAIDRCFGHPTVAKIRAALAGEGSDWAAATAETLGRLSPTSLVITLEQLRRGRALDYPAVVTMEYRMSQACMGAHDFYEGVRAIVVDKDRRPRWQPAAPEEVTPALVAAHFAKPAAGDLIVS